VEEQAPLRQQRILEPDPDGTAAAASEAHYVRWKAARGEVLASASRPSLSVAGDPLDRAAQAILGLLSRAATAAETNYQQAVEMTHKLSVQLRAAEDRMRELEAHARHHQERAERAERWLYQISVEIEQKFFGRTEARPSQPPPPEALIRNQRR
jgi:hypothetical protein